MKSSADHLGSDRLTRERVLQDAGPWTWYLAEAWQQAASPEVFLGAPRDPVNDAANFYANVDPIYMRVAYWGPVLHLTTLALGWKRPELGLWQWRKQGRPDTDPVLATLATRYGKDLDLLNAWLFLTGAESLRSSVFNDHSAPATPKTNEMKVFVEEVRNSSEFKQRFGTGGDPSHLVNHLEPPVIDGTAPSLIRAATKVGGDHVDYLLIGDHYRSLFAHLHVGAVPELTEGRSTRVAVMCPPVGWLGNYRRSRATGLWFRGRHRWHELGN